MKTKALILILVTVMPAFLAGCDPEPAEQAMPEVNDENCQLEKIMQIADRTTREQFSGLCSRRSTGAETLPANPKKW
ncbi:entry exclusion lipoprotein TrbK [Methylotuvimicrobium buryatense]|uniref:entry exclusion lipoprotein TrbK n=1 Tax=Methylotuvimicrobium TaxID=2822410 RepID=UPI00036D2642|nr:entry exclusion lipoprotein TrbK [Methylotuvimicrobium buryatense]